jgi:O-antigen ligase
MREGAKHERPADLVPWMCAPWATAIVRPEHDTLLRKSAFAFLWLLVYAIPWENAVVISGVGTTARLIGIIALGVGLLAIFVERRVRALSPGHIIIALFMLWAAISYLWSVDPEWTLRSAFSYFQLFSMVWLIWEFSPRKREQMRLIQAYVLGTYVSAIDTLYGYISHQQADYQRYASTGFNPNDLGLTMALSIPVSYYLMIQSQGRMVWICRLQLVLAGAAILLTASRGAGLASVVALAVIPWTLARLGWRRRLSVILTVALAGGVLFLAPSTSWERLSTIPNELTQGTLSERTVVWKAGWEVFREHPFFGVGAGAFPQSVQSAIGLPMFAHNTFLSILVEEGVIGFGFLCALMGVLGACAKEMPQLPRRVWIVSLGVWIVGVCGGSWELRKPTWFFFGLLIAQWASLIEKQATIGRAGLCSRRLLLGNRNYENPFSRA